MIAMRRHGSGMDGYGNGMMDGSGAWFAMLLGLLLLLALAWIAVYWIARTTGSASSATPPAAPALPPRDVLDLRLARGQITPEDYRTTTRLLDRSD